MIAVLKDRSLQQQVSTILRNPDWWGLNTNSSGHLAIGMHDVTDLREQYGSPLLVVNENRLHEDAKHILMAMKAAPPGSQTLYSYKTNCIPGILSKLHGYGLGAEVISPYELWLAQKLGVPGGSIVYNGVNKTRKSIEAAAKMDILSINIDHIEEIERIYVVARDLNHKIRVGIRLGLFPSSQFGMELENGEALDACKAICARCDHLKLTSLHFNVTSNAKSAGLHKQCVRKAVDFMAGVKKTTGVDFEYLDIGGGFGVPTTKNMSGIEYGLYRTFNILPAPPSPNDFQPMEAFIAEICDCVQQACQAKGLSIPKLIIEPGRNVTSRAEFLLVTVQTIKTKRTGVTFAITDAGRLSLTFPLDFEYHEVFLANRMDAPLDTCYQVMGRICTSADWMYKNRFLPRLVPNDMLAVMDAGAYFSSYSSNFAFPRPAIIMVGTAGIDIVRRGETFEHLVGMDVFRD